MNLKHTSLIFLLCLMALPLSGHAANSAKCEEALRDTDIIQRDLKLSCEGLKQCLVRRDTCVTEGIPNNEVKCQHLDECMKLRDKDFGDFANCRYTWAGTGKDLRCSVKKKFVGQQDRCPGRILSGFGLMGMMLGQVDIIDFSVDGEFNCDGSNKYFLSQAKALDRAKDRIRQFCINGVKKAASFEKIVCDDSKNFKPVSNGQYALPPQGTSNTNINEGNGGELGSGNEGGGEESGGGSSPKPKGSSFTH